MTQIRLADCAGQPVEHRRLNLRALKVFGGLAEISHHLREARAPESRRNLTWVLLQGCAARSIQVETSTPFISPGALSSLFLAACLFLCNTTVTSGQILRHHLRNSRCQPAPVAKLSSIILDLECA